MENTSTTLSSGWAGEQNQNFLSSRANRIARNAVTSMDVMPAARDISTMPTYHDTYGVALSHIGSITNQKQSGRCWMFTAYNVLRHNTIKFLDVENFEFSQSYGMFFDKLEKAHASLTYAIKTADKPLNNHEVMWHLDSVAQDGGYFSYAMSMVDKWGVVPKSAMPESACSENSEAMDAQLERLLHKDMLRLRKMFAEGATTDELNATKDEMLKEVYQLLAICLGNPPQTFDLICEVGSKCKADTSLISEITPKDPEEEKDATDSEDTKEAHSDNNGSSSDAHKDTKDTDKKKDERRVLRHYNLTAQSFTKTYVQVNTHDYVQLASIPHSDFSYNKVYFVKNNESVIDGCMPSRFLNVAPEVLEQAAIASLKADHPVSMACDVCQEFPRYIDDFKYVLALDTVDCDGLFGIDFGMTRNEMLDARETCLTHAMTFQGVELDRDGHARAWRVENSWGTDRGKDGFLIMSADWFRLYGGEVDVAREFVDEDLLKIWDTPEDDIVVDPWSGMGHALARTRM